MEPLQRVVRTQASHPRSVRASSVGASRKKKYRGKIGINAYAQGPEIKSLLRGACDTCRVKLGALPSAAIAETEKGAV